MRVFRRKRQHGPTDAAGDPRRLEAEEDMLSAGLATRRVDDRARVAVECWFFAASAFPRDYAPLAV
jgi:hypothetical protein